MTFPAFKFNPDWVDLSQVHLPSYPTALPNGTLPDSRPAANLWLDGRAAAAISATVGVPVALKDKAPLGNALLELKIYGLSAPGIYILTSTNLAAMAYADYFPGESSGLLLRNKVNAAVLEAFPGWCGQFGPDVDQLASSNYEGNYDMSEMFILPVVYNYYNELTPAAREMIITPLLARGCIRRASESDTYTSGALPNDWSRAGFVEVGVNLGDIPETENHVLMIGTARYLTNQLLYQRNPDPNCDNRRNGCRDQLLGLLRNYLRDDFAEYNAKNYQEETRHALLNLCSYAYDAEVKLGARMVLDYVAAHVAVSSSDLRRMVPFRRRNENNPATGEYNVNQMADQPGVMDFSLLDANGADPMSGHFALLAGNTRAYEFPNNRIWPPNPGPARPWPWAITNNFNAEMTLEAISDYRLPPSVHDLFVNDLHRRFYQRLHRIPMLDEPGQQRNCDNFEIYAGSPSYLITAGGEPATWVIPGKNGQGYQDQNKGVALPISFLPTARSAGPAVDPNDSTGVIQLLQFSEQPILDSNGGTKNYGVAPDFACGFKIYLPPWTAPEIPVDQDGLFFLNRGSHPGELAGFYLAILKQNGFAILEAFDTWLHPEVSFDTFRAQVVAKNPALTLKSGQPNFWTTYFGNRINFVIWNSQMDNYTFGSKIISIAYGQGNPNDTLAAAGNVDDHQPFLTGTVMQSPQDGIVAVTNTFLGSRLTLDWSNPAHLVRTDENGNVEQAGVNSNNQPYDVWVDFTWNGTPEGDFFHPFVSVPAALAAVADGGTIHLVPGSSWDRTPLSPNGKKVRLVAQLQAVSLGAPRFF
jgi:hypothetical protein